jgi:L-asparaginase
MSIDQEYRSKIARACVYSNESRIIILHEEETIDTTIELLAGKVGLGEKTIVLTTDISKINMALEKAWCSPPGIYVVMKGRYFVWDKVRKNCESDVFEEMK